MFFVTESATVLTPTMFRVQEDCEMAPQRNSGWQAASGVRQPDDQLRLLAAALSGGFGLDLFAEPEEARVTVSVGQPEGRPRVPVPMPRRGHEQPFGRAGVHR